MPDLRLQSGFSILPNTCCLMSFQATSPHSPAFLLTPKQNNNSRHSKQELSCSTALQYSHGSLTLLEVVSDHVPRDCMTCARCKPTPFPCPSDMVLERPCLLLVMQSSADALCFQLKVQRCYFPANTLMTLVGICAAVHVSCMHACGHSPFVDRLL